MLLAATTDRVGRPKDWPEQRPKDWPEEWPDEWMVQDEAIDTSSS